MQDISADLVPTDGSRTNPLLFVVGCQRSGTTMLQRMLDAHPMLAVAYDSLFIPRVLRGESAGFDPPLTDEVVDLTRTHPRFGRLGLSDEAVARAAAGARVYSEFVTAIYDELARAHSKPHAGEKSPGYCRHLLTLHSLLPWTKIVHLIRDGRDIALSIRDWGKGAAKLDLWKTEPIAAGALWWRRDVTRGCRDGRTLPGGCTARCGTRTLWVIRPEPCGGWRYFLDCRTTRRWWNTTGGG